MRELRDWGGCLLWVLGLFVAALAIVVGSACLSALAVRALWGDQDQRIETLETNNRALSETVASFEGGLEECNALVARQGLRPVPGT